MSVTTTSRPASLGEVIAEMDRRGDVIQALESRVAELEAELARQNKWLNGAPFQPTWENPDGPTAA